MGREALTGELTKVGIDLLLEVAAEEDRLRQERWDALLHFGYDSGVRFGDADLLHWVRLPSWTPEQIAALSLGKDPALANWEVCGPKAGIYPFCKTFAQRCVVADSWVQAGKLADPTPPEQAVEWMIQMRFIFPEELEAAIKLMGGRLTDWKAAHGRLLEWAQKLSAEHTAALEQHEVAIRERDELIEAYAKWSANAQDRLKRQDEENEALTDARDALTEEVDRLGEQCAEHEATFDSREKTTLQKALLGWAVGELGYKFDGKPSPIPAEMVETMNEIGLKVSAETLSNKIREAGARLLGEQAAG